MTVTALSLLPGVQEGDVDSDGALPPDIYRVLRAWKQKERDQKKKKQAAIAERDSLAEQLRVKRLEFDCLYKAVKCGRLSKRAQLEIRQLVKLQLRLSETEMLEWEKRKTEELPTLEPS